jgi:hypothetical protein
MAQIANEGLLPFRCRQFYPTNESSGGRDSWSFIALLEKVEPGTSATEISASYLQPLG